jgi:hypothetical protein
MKNFFLGFAFLWAMAIVVFGMIALAATWMQHSGIKSTDNLFTGGMLCGGAALVMVIVIVLMNIRIT